MTDVRCILVGCGRVLTDEQVKAWKLTHKKYLLRNGPFCSRECYTDSRNRGAKVQKS